MSDKTNPYVQGINQMLYFPDLFVGPAESTATYNGVVGSVCLCEGDYCNGAEPPRHLATVLIVAMAMVVLHRCIALVGLW